MPRPDERYVQYGCGLSAPEQWLNFDASPTLRLQRIPVIGKLVTKTRFPNNVRYGDITKGLPLPSASCKGIYCSHILEHLSLEDLRTSLENTAALLAPGGVFRLVVPDLAASIKIYSEATERASAAYTFMRSTMLGTERRPRTVRERLIAAYGNSHHLWMWDEAGMRKELLDAGFRNIRRCAFNDASDQRFREVEDESRFYRALAMEATI